MSGAQTRRERLSPSVRASPTAIKPIAAMMPTIVPMKLSSKMSPVPIALATIPPTSAPPIPISGAF
jgi:hypothetical protein